MTDFEEQKMIERAQAGDAEAKFEMSQWALERGAEEPEEERWKRLAAKCLVEAAQAGYEPAQEMMQKLMAGVPISELRVDAAPASEAPNGAESFAAEEAPQDEPFAASAEADGEEKTREWSFASEGEEPTVSYRPLQQEPAAESFTPAPSYTTPSPAAPEKEVPFFMDLEEAEGLAEEEDEPEAAPQNFGQKLLGGLQKAGAVLVALVAGLAAKIKKGDSELDEDEAADEPADETEDYAPTPSERRAVSRTRDSRSGLVRWVNDNWKILGPLCIALIVVMAILIVLMLAIPAKEPEPEILPTPMPTPTIAPTPTPEPFPSEAVHTEINTDAGLSYRPSNDEFLSGIQNYAVDSDDGMNMRTGPNTDYDIIVRLASQQGVAAYASHKSGEDTWYLINADGDWGWVIADYLVQR